jgi:hypothetical protein
VARIGEPWISHFEPAPLTRDLLAMGFSTAEAIAPREINERYFLARSDGLRVIGASGAIMNARLTASDRRQP